jgi:predicted GIY-YIG superfamily endonuclease
MLRCSDGSYYVGCTTNLDNRMGEHQDGTHGGYTSLRRPVELIWVEEFQHIDDAITVERQLKGWSRAKKAALLTGDYAAISRLFSRART